jgi:isopentenyl phosphate kinase
VTTVLKLGGSVITDKATPETVDDDALDRAVGAIADADVSRLLLVHGAGSFGHHYAETHGVTPTDGSHDAVGVWEIHDSMRRLNDEVVGRLQSAGVPALPVHPLSAGARDADSRLSLASDTTATMLAEGFVPVLHGDVIAHADAGATIISGDEVVTHLARGLDADRVGLCSTVEGVYGEDGDVVSEITDALDGVGGETVLLAERADARDEFARVARAAVEPDDEGEVRRVDPAAVVALDPDRAAHRRAERVRARGLPVLDVVLRAVGALGQFLGSEFDAEFSRRGVDAGDDDGGRRAEARTERDLALDADVEPGRRRVGGVAGLFDRGVDVAHAGVDEARRDVDVGAVLDVAGVLDGEAVEAQIPGFDPDVVVLAGVDGDGGPTLDGARDRGFAVDDRVLPEEVHLAGGA